MTHRRRVVRGLRRAFTMAEILIALAIIGIVGVALTRILLSQSAGFRRDVSARRARSGSRSAINVMITDLRMTQDVGGVVVANDSTVTVRVPTVFGLVCSTGANVTIATVPSDTFALRNALYGGYALRNATIPSTYTYVAAGASGTRTLASKTACSALPVPVRPDTVKQKGDTGFVYVLTPLSPSLATPGQPAFLWHQVSYRFRPSTTISGARGLFRDICDTKPTPTCTTDEIMAPFSPAARFNYFLNSASRNSQDSSVKTLATGVTDVRGVEIVLAAFAPDTIGSSRGPESATTVTSVFFKNVGTP